MQQEKVLREATLCFPVRGSEVMLALKTKKIGQGCWNGYGGGTESGESLEECACRELYEESGVRTRPRDFEKAAVVDFHNTKSDGTAFVCRVHVYLVGNWVGEFKETKTMIKPTWFRKNELPLNEMMLADRFWLPPVLEGKKIVAKAKYGPFQKELLDEVMIEEAEILPER